MDGFGVARQMFSELTENTQKFGLGSALKTRTNALSERSHAVPAECRAPFFFNGMRTEEEDFRRVMLCHENQVTQPHDTSERARRE